MADGAAAPRERPILFSGPLVRAILAGRKSVTRRIVRPQPRRVPIASGGQGDDERGHFVLADTGDGEPTRLYCPFGGPGGLLWVRETWGQLFPGLDYEPVFYRADYDADAIATQVMPAWRPSIHMPRAYSRLTLRVSSVRVERLQQITVEAIEAEGLKVPPCLYDKVPERPDVLDFERACWARQHFAENWDVINGARGSWASDPYVWVIGFERVEASP